MAERLPAFYAHPNVGNHMVIGFSTKVVYGYFGGGTLVPGGVFPADIKTHPHLYTCGNCRSPFVVTSSGEVRCSQCSRAQISAFATGRPIEDETFIEQPPEELPPPILIEEQPPKEPGGNFAEVNYMDLTEVSISGLEFGGFSHDRYAKLLEENGIVTLADAVRAGHDGLTAIKGIGDATARAILSYA